jgi:hypothetical protein
MATCKDCLYRCQIDQNKTWCKRKNLGHPRKLEENVPCDKYVAVTEQQYNDYQRMDSAQKRNFTKKLKFDPVKEWNFCRLKKIRWEQMIMNAQDELGNLEREMKKLEKEYPVVISALVAEEL